MKKRLFRAASFILAFILTLMSVTPAFAASQTAVSSGKVLRESLELEHGTMYLEETDAYRLVFIVYNNGKIDYSICYRNNQMVVYSGEYSPTNTRGIINAHALSSDQSQSELAKELLQAEPTEIIDFGQRESQYRASITTVAQARAYAIQNAPGWETPVSYRLLDTYYGSKTVQLYEYVAGDVSQESIVSYYMGDSLAALATLYFGFTLVRVLKVITYTWRLVDGYVAEKNGSLTYFKIDNTRTKMARIDGVTYYWSGWDMHYSLISGDKGNDLVVDKNLAYADYNYSLAYWGEKAITNYENYPDG